MDPSNRVDHTTAGEDERMHWHTIHARRAGTIIIVLIVIIAVELFKLDRDFTALLDYLRKMLCIVMLCRRRLRVRLCVRKRAAMLALQEAIPSAAMQTERLGERIVKRALAIVDGEMAATYGFEPDQLAL